MVVQVGACLQVAVQQRTSGGRPVRKSNRLSLVAELAQALGEQLDLRRLAGSVAALEHDEEAPLDRLHGTKRRTLADLGAWRRHIHAMFPDDGRLDVQEDRPRVFDVPLPATPREEAR